MAHRPVPGSHRSVPFGAYRVGDADPDTYVEATVVLRRPADGVIEADPVDVSGVLLFATAHGLSVVASHPSARAVTVGGSLSRMNAAFNVELGEYAHDGETYRGREGAVHVPEEIADSVVAVLGLDERRAAYRPEHVSPMAHAGLSPAAVASRYGFPATADGAGQTIAVIELGGGYRQSDLNTYFPQMGLKVPSVTAVPVGGAQNSPGQSADSEVALDIQVIGAVAQGAKQAVYFAPNTDAGFYQAIATAINDQVNKPSIISISWGGPESSWTAQALNAFDNLFVDAAKLGITVLAASGDNGSSDGTSGNAVDFPASSPHVLACGGTTLTQAGETAWNEISAGEGATGGGVSTFFAKPSYQSGVNVPGQGRGVPDVAGDADPTTGYTVLINGRWGVVGGTSAVAPLWAGLVALSNEINGNKAGAPHAKLYANPSAFNDIVSGNNGAFSASQGWDATCGLGSPKGMQIVQVLADNPPPSGGGTGGTGTGTGTPAPPVAAPSNTPIIIECLQAQAAALNSQLAALNTAISALKSLGG